MRYAYPYNVRQIFGVPLPSREHVRLAGSVIANGANNQNER
jgi:hypothetical protein